MKQMLIFMGRSGQAQDSPAPAPLVSILDRNQPVPESYFGMTMGGIIDFPWPTVSFDSMRTWDTFGYNSINDAYVNLYWRDLHPSAGVFNWELLDAILEEIDSHGGMKAFYTFGYAPLWLTGGHTVPPTGDQLEHWDAFVSALATRAAGRIKYWGLWNEANESNYYSGTHAQLVEMARRAHSIIKAIDPTAIICSPEVIGNAVGFLTGFLNAGGGEYIDVVAVHQYGYPDERAAVDGGALGFLTAYKAAMVTAGVSDKPIWNTEFSSFGEVFDVSDVAFIGKTYPLFWTAGVDRNYWYEWSSPEFGTMWRPVEGLYPASVAYTQVRDWMLGAVISGQPVVAGDVWYIDMTREGGYEGRIVWHDGGTSSFTIPAGAYVQYRDLAGGTTAVSGAATSVTITNSAILLENQAA